MNPILKRTLTGLGVGAAVICAALLAPQAAIDLVVLAVAFFAVCEYVALLSKKGVRRGPLAVCAVVAGSVVVLAGLVSLARIPPLYGDATCGGLRLGNVMLLYVIAVVKFSDVGGFAFGLSSARMMKGGNHKMCPSVSPNKSWEGLAGSVFASCLVSCLFMGATGFGWGKSLACGAAAALVGTAGDLVESKFKRWAGVKDSSTMRITNGMGGVLDMVDSLLFAPAVLMMLMGLDF